MTFNEIMIDDLLHKIEMQNQKIGKMQKEIERLHEVIDIKDNERIELVKENNQLKLRNKMLTKIGLNSIYGIHCCKNHCVYTGTDSIKTESEEKTNDDNN